MRGKKQPTIPPQAQKTYLELQKQGKPLTASQIATKLNVFPHTIYRAANLLHQSGLLQKINTYPMTFCHISTHKAAQSFLLNQNNWFSDVFQKSVGQDLKQGLKSTEPLQISFIQSRKNSINLSTQDIMNSKKQICLLISGVEIPAETVLAIKRAIDRGVVIKVIAQTEDRDHFEMLKNWKHLGIQVKTITSIEARIMIFDKIIAYIMSYNIDKPEENLGIRFNYLPIAVLMQEIFDQRWKISKMM